MTTLPLAFARVELKRSLTAQNIAKEQNPTGKNSEILICCSTRVIHKITLCLHATPYSRLSSSPHTCRYDICECSQVSTPIYLDLGYRMLPLIKIGTSRSHTIELCRLIVPVGDFGSEI